MPGHVHSIWLRHVGVGGNAYPQERILGDYAQATYSSNGDGGIGSRAWSPPQQDVPPICGASMPVQGAAPIILTSGKQVNFAQWSPDGTQIDYLDSIALGVGAFHTVNVTTLVIRLSPQASQIVPHPPGPSRDKNSSIVLAHKRLS